MAHYSFSAKCTLRLFSASIFHFIFILFSFYFHFSFISTLSSIFPHRLKNLSISTCVHITSPVLQQLSTATPIHQLQAAPWPNSHPKEPKLNLKSIWVWYQMRLGSIFPPLCVESKMCCISIYYISILKHTLEPRERGCEDREDFSGKHHPGWGEPPLSSIQRFLPCFLPTGSWPAGQLHHGLPDRHLPSWRWAWRLQWTLPAQWRLGSPAGLSSSACTTVQNWGLWSCPVPCTSPALSGGTQPSRLSLNRQPAKPASLKPPLTCWREQKFYVIPSSSCTRPRGLPGPLPSRQRWTWDARRDALAWQMRFHLWITVLLSCLAFKGPQTMLAPVLNQSS